MAAAYTHYCFGKDVLHRLPKDIQKFLLKYRDTYMIGQQGPDILFFYKPFIIKNKVCQKGIRMHKRFGRELTERARVLYKTHKNDYFKAYYMGFLCHFMLDSNVHSYIRDAVFKYGVSHSDIEAHMDRYLMRKDGRNFLVLNPYSYMQSSADACDAIAPFYGLSSKTIYKSIDQAIHYKHYLLYNMGIVSSIANGLFIITRRYKKVQGFIGFKGVNPKCFDTTRDMLDIYEKTLEETLDVLEYCFRNFDNNEPLPERLDTDFAE